MSCLPYFKTSYNVSIVFLILMVKKLNPGGNQITWGPKITLFVPENLDSSISSVPTIASELLGKLR